jgi:tetratricopeptide (TPR) repeat protein
VAAELAASRPDDSLAGLAGELADQQRRLDLLDVGGDPRAAVRAVFSWSCRRLDPGAARMFRLAALHPGPDLDTYAAAALVGTTPEQASHLLTRLARAYLIQPAAPGRYGMHDLLRAYARELAQEHEPPDEQRAALARLLDYYVRAAGAAAAVLSSGEHDRPHPGRSRTVIGLPLVTDVATAREWLDAERSSLVATVGYAADQGDPRLAADLAATVFPHLDVRGWYAEAIAINAHAVTAARRLDDQAGEANALLGLGVLDWRQDRCEQATHHFLRALTLFREIGDPVGGCRALGNLGLVEHAMGRYRQAAGYARQALDLFREIGDQTGAARALGNLGVAEWRLGAFQPAESHFREALALFRDEANQEGEATTLSRLGNLVSGQGHYQESAGYCERAAVICRQIGHKSGEAGALLVRAEAELRHGSHQPAASRFRQVLVLLRELDDKDGEARVCNGLGEICLAAGRPDDARREHATALDLARQAAHPYNQARAHDGLAQSFQAMGDLAQATWHWQEALAIYARLGVPEGREIRARLAAAD